MAISELQVAPYGSWKSPITSELIVAGSVGLGTVVLDGEDIYWSESRPNEGGRNVIVQRTPDGQIRDVTPAPFNVRTRAHEYGGGAFLVVDGTVYFSNFANQRLYRQIPGQAPEPLTPEVAYRYADGLVDRDRNRFICVREDHTLTESEIINTLVSINLADGSEQAILATGKDFYASPRLSPDGKQLAWICWNHPLMPWDGTELWVADVLADGSLGEVHQVAGGLEESIFQPEWSPDGVLYLISDRSGWWNLYRWLPEPPLFKGGQGRPDDSDAEAYGWLEPVCPMEAEFGLPQWVFGMTTYAFESSGQILCTYTEAGESHIASLDTATGKLSPLSLPYFRSGSIQAAPGVLVLGAGSPIQPGAIVRVDLATQTLEVLRRASELVIDEAYLSVPEAIAFPTENGLTAYGYFYPPKNGAFTAPENERPPLLVKSHGGPTAATSAAFSLSIQYWTSRGIGVLDVNYGGSTGYGRAYRERLKGQWGIVDVDDCANGAKYLVALGSVDGDRLVISGGSAGGYTTLCALTFRDTFKAGASYYGVSDLAALATDTHKFESRYLDSLIGPYPEQEDLYRERSPIYATDLLSCPVIFFQGDEDKVVPPSQSELMVNALRSKKLPVAYVLFQGEQHGFRKAENIKSALDGELFFYSRVFGFELADPVPSLAIENL
ncbi:MAG: S9 family peptidase [Scytolyngbya sp. HA4215-MV1]|nr:S9 family peptidase [Scytolyngbya sp. HA4215-MV1]